jgi:hypothetical protein
MSGHQAQEKPRGFTLFMFKRRCCANDIPSFVKEEDIQSIEWANDNDDDDKQRKTKTHIRVQWDKERLGHRLPTPRRL